MAVEPAPLATGVSIGASGCFEKDPLGFAAPQRDIEATHANLNRVTERSETNDADALAGREAELPEPLRQAVIADDGLNASVLTGFEIGESTRRRHGKENNENDSQNQVESGPRLRPRGPRPVPGCRSIPRCPTSGPRLPHQPADCCSPPRARTPRACVLPAGRAPNHAEY